MMDEMTRRWMGLYKVAKEYRDLNRHARVSFRHPGLDDALDRDADLYSSYATDLSLRACLDDVPFNPPRITGALGAEWRTEKIQDAIDDMDQ